MHKNLLIDPIFKILENTPAGLSEYELICQLTAGDHDVIDKIDKDGLALFKKHFMVMNALYSLQQQLLPEGKSLSISALFIQLQDVSEPAGGQSIALGGEERLRAYYLDWDNLEKTTGADVEQLLSSFWSHYLALNERDESLVKLGLGHKADWQEIKKNYRRLAKDHHPDKGGEEARFIEIREAYEILARIYNPTTSTLLNK